MTFRCALSIIAPNVVISGKIFVQCFQGGMKIN